MWRWAWRGLSCAVGILSVASGCTTTATSDTARTATEQVLISNSVDQVLNKVDFRPFAGRTVFLEQKYLDAVDKNYIVGSIRHRVMHAGATLAEKPEQADVILEVRSGAVGTNKSEMFLGMPKIALPGPMPISLPEIKLVSRTSQQGIAKLGLMAYDARSRRPLGGGGVSLARSDDNNWYLLGMGPLQNGTVRSEVSESLNVPARRPSLPKLVAFGSGSSDASGRTRLASGTNSKITPPRRISGGDEANSRTTGQ